jgi:hypothetical protein
MKAMKAEGRNPKPEGRPNFERRTGDGAKFRPIEAHTLDFIWASDFGLRIS